MVLIYVLFHTLQSSGHHPFTGYLVIPVCMKHALALSTPCHSASEVKVPRAQSLSTSRQNNQFSSVSKEKSQKEEQSLINSLSPAGFSSQTCILQEILW